MIIDPAALDEIRADYAHCFGCGRDNPIGLRLDGFAVSGDVVTATFVPRPEYAGFAGVLHGGVLAAALDEILAWSAVLLAGTLAVTVTMDLKFRAPAPPDAEYSLTGRLVERRGKRLIIEGTCDLDGEVVAEARALFLATEAVAAVEQ